jgi:GNAT superfamily N-acetyltransferase
MIRNIAKTDYGNIIQMLKNYRDASGIESVSRATNEIYIELLLNHIRAGRGVGLVAERDGEAVGLLLALLNPSVWHPEDLQLQELVFWVEPKARYGRVGYLLLKEYVRIGQAMKRTNMITNFTMTRRAGTQLNYSRFGFRPVDENWSQ